MKRNSNNFVRALVSLSFAALAPVAFAYDGPTPVAKVVVVEGSFAPGALYFVADQQVANCPAGEWLTWEGGAAYPRTSAVDIDRKANVKMTFTALLAAMHASGRVRVYARNKTATVGCIVEFLHALPAA
jgi:hypothetical protein